MKDRDAFIEALADYLIGDQTEMSVKLSMHLPEAEAWAKLRNLTPLFGWVEKDEAVRTLKDFLGGGVIR